MNIKNIIQEDQEMEIEQLDADHQEVVIDHNGNYVVIGNNSNIVFSHLSGEEIFYSENE